MEMRKTKERRFWTLCVTLKMEQIRWLKNKGNASEFLRAELDKLMANERERNIAKLKKRYNELNERGIELTVLMKAAPKEQRKKYEDEYNEILQQLEKLRIKTLNVKWKKTER